MPPSPDRVSTLEAHLGYWLRFVSNQVSLAFGERLAAQGVSVADWVILRELYDVAALPPSVLAGRIGMTKGAVTKIADRLIARGLVSRTASADDRRAQSLALTREGRRLVPKLAALADRNDADFFGHLPARERKTIEAAMRDIVRRLGLKSIPIE